MKHTLHLAQYDAHTHQSLLTRAWTATSSLRQRSSPNFSSIELIENEEFFWFLSFANENSSPFSDFTEKAELIRKIEVQKEVRDSFYGLTQNRFKKTSFKVVSSDIYFLFRAAVESLDMGFRIVELAIRQHSCEHFLYITCEDRTHLPQFQNCLSIGYQHPV